MACGGGGPMQSADIAAQLGVRSVIVPPHPGLFSPTEFGQLHAALGGVILATANYSAVKATAGPSAPITWMKRSLAELKPPSEEAASKLISNHKGVLKDVTNRSSTLNIIGAPLTQLDLRAPLARFPLAATRTATSSN